jgi:Uma2 family endonuclease
MSTSSSSAPAPWPVKLTYADLQTLPEDGRRYEILEGELCVTPAPTTHHQRISRNLEFALHAHVSEFELGEVLYAPVDVMLDRQTVVQPDIVFVSTARLALVGERAIEGAPDLVVEIASPATEQRDRGAKQQLYARYEVAHYWRIDPAASTLTELVLEQGGYVLRATHRAGEPFRSELFPRLSIDLAAVLRVPPAKPAE